MRRRPYGNRSTTVDRHRGSRKRPGRLLPCPTHFSSSRRVVMSMSGLDTHHITMLVERALTEEDPIASLRALTELRSRLDQLERAQVARALATGQTFTAIAAPLVISRQAAHRRYRDLVSAPPPSPAREPPTLSPEARAALV